MNRGFVPLVVIAIVSGVLVSVLTAGGAYTVYKVNQLQEENVAIKTELQEQKQNASETVSEASTSTKENSVERSEVSDRTEIEINKAEITVNPLPSR